MGNDAFYGSVALRADAAISQWLRERKEDAR
jgi:hypothetical protein